MSGPGSSLCPPLGIGLEFLLRVFKHNFGETSSQNIRVENFSSVKLSYSNCLF